jgi:hypothetical protein
MKRSFFFVILFLLVLSGINAQNKSFDWGFSIYGGQGTLQQTNDMVLDKEGNIIATGYYTDSGLDFDPGTSNNFLSGHGGKDVFVAKYNQDGKFIWAFGIGSNLDDEGKSICIDHEGNIFITGYFHGVMDVDPGEKIFSIFGEPGYKQTFIAKYNGKDGSLIWAGMIKSSSDNTGIDISADASGSITLSGNWRSNIRVPIVLEPNNQEYYKLSEGEQTGFIAQYDGKTGKIKWGGILSGTNAFCEITAHITDSKGNIYTTGHFNESVDFDIHESRNEHKSNFGSTFLAMYNEEGSLKWVNTFPHGSPAKTNILHDLCIDNSGNITITGALEVETDLDPSLATAYVTPKSSQNILLAQYDALGNYKWSNIIGSETVARGLTIAASPAGTIYLAGVFKNQLNPNPVSSSTTLFGFETDIFMAKYSENGQFIWAEKLGGSLDDTVSAIVVDGKGKLVLGGAVDGSGNFDPTQQQQALFAGNKGDIFIAKYDSRVEPVFTFNPPLPKTYGDQPFLLMASVNSGLLVTFISSDPSVIKISGDTAIITGAGSSAISIVVEGNENYHTGTSAPKTILVNKAQQTITLEDFPVKTYGDAPFTPQVLSNSGLSVVLSSEDPAIATTSGNLITITGAGTVYINAWSEGDKNYFPSTIVPKELTVNKATQTILFEPLAERTYGEPSFSINASSTSGLALQFESSDSSVATVTGNVITLTGFGSTFIIARQEGNDNYLPATMERILYVRPPLLSISGREIVAENTLQVYSIIPALSGHTYAWEYSDENVVFPNKTGPSIAIGFNKDSENGNLRCIIYTPEGLPYDTVNFAIKINRGATVILPGTSCPASTTFESCAGGHIDYFSLASLENKHSG